MSATKTTVGTILARLGKMINDNHAKSAARWSSDDRLAALREGICQALHHRPSEFVEEKEVCLVAGSKQNVPTGCKTILSVDCNQDGSIIGTSTEGTDDFLNATAGLSIGCTTPGNYTGVSNARISETNPRIFYVEPPVPEGTDYKVSVSAVPEAPSISCVDDEYCIPCGMEAAVIEWALYRLYSYEDDSRFGMQKQEHHFDRWSRLLGLHYLFAQRNAALADGIPPYGTS